jgi:polyphosphate glucokinase
MTDDQGLGTAGPTTLVLDIGGTGLKAAVLDPAGVMRTERVRVATTYPCPPDQLVAQLDRMVRPLSTFDRLSVGFPGVVRVGVILSAPHFITTHGPGSPVDEHLAAAWTGFDLAAALTHRFDRPVRIINDADLQGLDVATGDGVEVVITLGTGLGSAVFENGHLGPHLELAHHPFRKGQTYNEQLGDAALKKAGRRKWNQRVQTAIATLAALFFYDHLYIGGGNSRHLTNHPDPKVTIIDANAGLLGGLKLWDQPTR